VIRNGTVSSIRTHARTEPDFSNRSANTNSVEKASKVLTSYTDFAYPAYG
jgi:hypothetical protein